MNLAKYLKIQQNEYLATLQIKKQTVEDLSRNFFQDPWGNLSCLWTSILALRYNKEM